MKNIIIHLLLFFASLNFIACNNEKNKLQEGDLLFQDLNCGDLCNAIEAVTDGVNGKNFSHCAIIVKINDSLKVIEAIGDKVQASTITNFFARSGDTNIIKNITVARINDTDEKLIPQATSFIKKQINQPYDDEFILNNGKWYCSELLFEAFKNANNNKEYFNLNPMTFKDPKTKQFFSAWVDYYKSLNKEIPEGKLGLNPGSISLSKKLVIKKIDNFNFINKL